jgi:hypothetical protein
MGLGRKIMAGIALVVVAMVIKGYMIYENVGFKVTVISIEIQMKQSSVPRSKGFSGIFRI